MTFSPSVSAALLTLVGGVLAAIFREIRAIHKQQSAQGTLLLILLEQDESDVSVPDEIREDIR